MAKPSELETLRSLVKFQDKLLAAYRTGRHPGEATLDGMYKCKKRLSEILHLKVKELADVLA